ncbi:hypothetical protein TRICHSKD4_0993 [Roseibium sp. TrichSKD4]|uniref:hypothetical protein n=1 Tax=Roseibium sp. TrichSKD4 TaxID=744980 RepID=UPI0001E56322|nr:hypothetical protein [Roseibium sp. TrichSKD4]EFO33874.1 hypothetical protein TRICHSKD4_0993 [Roseibium sp. TrichSKD4]
MARFPYHKSKVSALGRLLAKAATDPAFKAELMQNPQEVLKKAALPDVTLQLFNFNVVDGAQNTPMIALPYRLNEQKVAECDPEYLAGVARLVPTTNLS